MRTSLPRRSMWGLSLDASSAIARSRKSIESGRVMYAAIPSKQAD